jgi:nitronate monooxygenase
MSSPLKVLQMGAALPLHDVRGGGRTEVTLFYASQEAERHQTPSVGLLALGSGQTLHSVIPICRAATVGQTPYTGRLLRNRHSERWLGHEDELATTAEQVGREYAAARERGDFDIAGVIAGEACALI